MRPKEIEKFYQQLGSAHFKLQAKIAQRFGESKIDIYFKSVGFTIQVLSIVGIIAGFGFTAYRYTESKSVFFLGETVLLLSIIYGISWVKKLYDNEYKSLDDAQKKHQKYFKERNDLFLKIHSDMVLNRPLNQEEIQKLMDLDSGAIKLFEPGENKDILKIYPPFVYLLLIVGSLILFSSFFWISFFDKLII
jgi:hypothetical protein